MTNSPGGVQKAGVGGGKGDGTPQEEWDCLNDMKVRGSRNRAMERDENLTAVEGSER